ncbi:MAG: 50S ribosomal protein L24e [Methanomicrobiales archaeon]|nr:50S ribosomal protein L24e [Methanomicrobiales archaeon]
MVETYKCSFCGDQVEPGTGKMFVKKDGSVFYFCSSKCQGNFRLGRVPRRVAWTEAGRKARGKE